MWEFVTDCVHSDGPSINEMTSAATATSYRAMLRTVRQPFIAKQSELGYDVGAQRGGLRMSKDWAVSYWRSSYRGRSCFYFVWSHIEYIFCEAA